MTLRVGKVGPGGVLVFGAPRTIVVTPDPTRMNEVTSALPPCECPRCRPDRRLLPHAARELGTQRGCTPVWSGAELWALWRM